MDAPVRRRADVEARPHGHAGDEHHVVTIPVATPTAKGPHVVGVITRRDAAGALKP
jgi:hypothetical protein